MDIIELIEPNIMYAMIYEIFVRKYLSIMLIMKINFLGVCFLILVSQMKRWIDVAALEKVKKV